MGLKINLEKSEFIPIVGVENVEELAGILGYRVGSLPSICLGLQLAESLDHLRVKMRWKKIFKNCLLCGRNNTCQKEECKLC